MTLRIYFEKLHYLITLMASYFPSLSSLKQTLRSKNQHSCHTKIHYKNFCLWEFMDTGSSCHTNYQCSNNSSRDTSQSSDDNNSKTLNNDSNTYSNLNRN